MSDADPQQGTARGLDGLVLPSQLKPELLLEWMEYARHFLYLGGMTLGANSAAVNAKLRKPPKAWVPIAGPSLMWRASKVSKPISQAGEALITSCQYMQQASNNFEAAFFPELEAIGYKPSTSDFWRP